MVKKGQKVQPAKPKGKQEKAQAGGKGGKAKEEEEVKVGENKLKSLYAALDNGQNKQALKQANALLAKHPGAQLVKVLKALAYLRMEERELAFQCFHEVCLKLPSDDLVLNNLLLVGRLLDRLDLVTLVFEAASKAAPSNLDLHIHVFFCHLREFNFKK